MAEIVHLQGTFAQAASTYEFRMGQITRHIARHICSKTLSNLLPRSPNVCDNACGTGAVTSAILSTFPDATVSATDIAPPMVAILRAQYSSSHQENKNNNSDDDDDDHHHRNGIAKFHAQVADSSVLPFPNAIFDVQVMNFGIFFIPNPTQAAREMYRTLKPGGVAVVTGWLSSTFFQLTFIVQDIVAPANQLRSMAMFDKWKDPAVVKATLAEAGFDRDAIEVENVATHAVFDSDAELVRYCVESIRSVLGELWTEEEVGRLKGAIERVVLDEHDETGKKYFGRDPQGRYIVQWTAWVAKVIK